MASRRRTGLALVLTTVGSAREASRLAGSLVEERLAACVNIVGPLRSVFRWQGKIERQREWLLLVKTSASCRSRLTRYLEGVHGYELPEIVSLAVTGGLPDYIAWVASQTTGGEARARPKRAGKSLTKRRWRGRTG